LLDQPAQQGLPARVSKEKKMNSIVWLVGAVVIVLAILSFLGLR
jgi:hypothetical protein